jgi:hypothetical protein
VVELEVGDGHVVHIGGIEPERPDLGDRRLLLPRLRSQREVERGTKALVGMAGVLGAETGLDEDQLVAGLDQKAMANGLG